MPGTVFAESELDEINADSWLTRARKQAEDFYQTTVTPAIETTQQAVRERVPSRYAPRRQTSRHCP